MPSEEVVAAHLHTLFVGMIVEEWAMFRVTRNADLTLEEDEADDLLEAVELSSAGGVSTRRSGSRWPTTSATSCSTCSSASSSSTSATCRATGR